MKKLALCSLVLLLLSCSENKNISPSETAKIVAESFFSKDDSTLKKYTTSEGYASLITVQNMLPESDRDIEVEILDKAIDNKIAWVKYKTTFDGKTGVFKLVKENDQWKVTHKEPRDNGPF